MHLLYLDDSGSAANPAEDYLVLGGISMHESHAWWVMQEMDKLAASINPDDPNSIEFHASEIFSCRQPPWKGMKKDEAKGVIKAVLQIARRLRDPARTFACAIHKASYAGKDPMQLAFEDLCSRFDRFLHRLRTQGDRQQGILILDESVHETTLQQMARDFRTLGTKWGNIHNLAEVPLFANSKASRALQLADHIAYAVFRRYNEGDVSYFNIIASKFDSDEGVIHGLAHKQTLDPECMCPACLSRRIQQAKTQEDQIHMDLEIEKK